MGCVISYYRNKSEEEKMTEYEKINIAEVSQCGYKDTILFNRNEFLESKIIL